MVNTHVQAQNKEISGINQGFGFASKYSDFREGKGGESISKE